MGIRKVMTRINVERDISLMALQICLFFFKLDELSHYWQYSKDMSQLFPAIFATCEITRTRKKYTIMTYLRRKKHISRVFSLYGPHLNKKFGKQFFWTHQKNWAVNVLIEVSKRNCWTEFIGLIRTR